MGRVAVLATCALNQWALDYQGNMDRILESIRRAKKAGATYLCGTELNIVGYSCGDHYHERDTEMHAWEVLVEILKHPDSCDIIVDVGLPVMHKNVIYNCKLVFLNRKVLFIRPKMILANDGSMGYRETRWFTEWTKVREVEEFLLPPSVRKVTGQTTVPFGDGVLVTKDTTIGYEICEELWNPESCHIAQCLDGAEIISNGLGSLEEYGRPGLGYQMVQMATLKSGGCYLLANQKGCDGSAGYYPGDACIGLNGSIVAHTPLYSLEEVDVITATVDLESIRRYKASIRSRCLHAAKSKPYPKIEVDFCIGKDDWWVTGIPSFCPMDPMLPTKEEQILKAPARWLWDFLRRSGYRGVLLPLSGNLDSSATAAIVFSMCHLVVDAVAGGNETVLADVRELMGNNDYVPSDAKELCGHLVYTFHAETSSLSQHAKEIISEISQQIGSHHVDAQLEATLAALEDELSPYVKSSLKLKEQYRKDEDTARHNLRLKLAHAAAAFLAESMVDTGNQRRNLLELASSNLDSGLKMDKGKSGETCGTLNLIGRFPEGDVIEFLQLAKDRLKLPALQKVLASAEASANGVVSAIFKDVVVLGNLHSVEGCGPFSMFGRAWHMWKSKDTTPKEVAEKVKRFFREYNIHRQIRTFISPTSFYMPSTGPPDEARPLFYPRAWPWQFQAIDEAVKRIEDGRRSEISETEDKFKE